MHIFIIPAKYIIIWSVWQLRNTPAAEVYSKNINFLVVYSNLSDLNITFRESNDTSFLLSFQFTSLQFITLVTISAF